MVLLIGFTTCVFAQSTKFTISGNVKTKKPGEIVIGAVVKFFELKSIGTSANEYGFYSLTNPC